MIAVIAGCASASAPSGDLPRDAPTGGTFGDAAVASDAHTLDAAIDGASPSGLDPDLSLPDPAGQTCHQPGAIGSPECPAIHVCRFYSSTEGRCESCSNCGNLGAACSTTSQCDILFECYQGRCTNFCTLGTTECGAPADCVHIGHATRGVCKP